MQVCGGPVVPKYIFVIRFESLRKCITHYNTFYEDVFELWIKCDKFYPWYLYYTFFVFNF